MICTNQFELFTDYGIQMKARSKALQTFVVQLAGAGTCLPTERAVRGGSYSAIVQSNLVGPEWSRRRQQAHRAPAAKVDPEAVEPADAGSESEVGRSSMASPCKAC